MIFKGSWLAIAYGKFSTGLPLHPDSWKRLVFLLVPCHILTLIDAFVLLRHSPFTQSINDMRIWYNFFPIAALLTPDTSDYVYTIEIIAFWVQHWFMAFVSYFL